MNISAADIKTQYETNFANTYHGAAPFMQSDKALWDLCMDSITDPVMFDRYVFCDTVLEISPVLVFLKTYGAKLPQDLTKQQAQWIGAFFGYLFKFILGYQGQKSRVSCKLYGVSTATLFLDAPDTIQFIKEESN